MKTIYLMRHGQTLFNVMKLNQGQCDSPLTEAGIERMQENGIKIMALHLMLSTALHRSVPVIRQNWLPIICLTQD